jgi:nucleotidyltransferase substrate binding protein (TIGR01987 family)
MQSYFKLIQVEESAIRSKNDLFREAARLHLIEDAEAWIGHYAARNESSHDYNTEKAEQVYAQAKLFLPDVKKLLETLENVA